MALKILQEGKVSFFPAKVTFGWPKLLMLYLLPFLQEGIPEVEVGLRQGKIWDFFDVA